MVKFVIKGQEEAQESTLHAWLEVKWGLLCLMGSDGPLGAQKIIACIDPKSGELNISMLCGLKSISTDAAGCIVVSGYRKC